jgi:hypothetical protein
MIKVNGKTYVTPQEAAQLLSVHLATVYGWCVHKRVDLLDPHTVQEPVPSKYLIEIESLKLRYAHVYL